MTIIWSDSFASGGRGVPNAWSPASNGQNWPQVRGADTLGFTGSEGTITGASSTFNILRAGTGTLGDCSIVTRMSYGNLTDIIGVVLGYQDNSNFYYADIGGAAGKIEIGRCLAGTFSSRATATFASSINTFYFLRFQRIGATLSAKIWPSGQTEPAGFNVSIVDSNLGAGGYGIGCEEQHNTAAFFDTFSADDTIVVGNTMANLGPTVTLVDINGNPLGTATNPVVTSTTLVTSPAAPLPVSEEIVGVQVSNSATAAAAAAATATLPGTAGKTTYIRGFAVSSQTLATAVSGLVTLAGILGGTLNFEYTENANGGLLIVTFGNSGLAASAQNTAIVLSLPAITGGAISAVSAWGVQI